MLNIQITNKGKSLLELPKNYTIIDLETTGLDADFNEIIEMSALKNYFSVPRRK